MNEIEHVQPGLLPYKTHLAWEPVDDGKGGEVFRGHVWIFLKDQTLHFAKEYPTVERCILWARKLEQTGASARAIGIEPHPNEASDENIH